MLFQDHVSFLRRIKSLREAKRYLEIGVQEGVSLLAEPIPDLVVGVDPAYRIATPIQSDCHCALFRRTSDDFFAQGCYGRVSSEPVDVAFVDGMHWADFCLRDIRNVERICHRNSVILVHDIRPRTAAEASIVESPDAWMGDVFKAIWALRHFRPDLSIVCLDDVPPSGMAVIWNLDPGNTVLFERYVDTITFMNGIDFTQDFERTILPTYVSTGSPQYDAMIDALAAMPKAAPHSNLPWPRLGSDVLKRVLGRRATALR